MFVSAGHTGIARAKEVPVALLITLVPLSCDVLTHVALMSTGPGVVGEASGSHDGLYENSFKSETYCKALRM